MFSCRHPVANMMMMIFLYQVTPKNPIQLHIPMLKKLNASHNRHEKKLTKLF